MNPHWKSSVMIGTTIITINRNKLERSKMTNNILNLRVSHVVPVRPLGHTHFTCPLLNTHTAPFLQGLFGQVAKINHKKVLSHEKEISLEVELYELKS